MGDRNEKLAREIRMKARGTRKPVGRGGTTRLSEREEGKRNEEMKRIATEAEENTMKHVLAFMPRLIYCDGFSRFILWRAASEQPGYSRGRLGKSRENMASVRERRPLEVLARLKRISR